VAWLGYILIKGEKGTYDGKTAAAITAAGHAAGFILAATTFSSESGRSRENLTFHTTISPALMGNQNPASKFSFVPGINMRCFF
jgi:hypothetical protein